MDSIAGVHSFTPNIIWAFVCVILFVSTVVSVMLLRDNRNKQKLYKNFNGNLNEFIVVLSQKLEFLYGLPLFLSDPLFDRLSSGRSFAEILGSSNWNRMRTYMDEIEKHLEMPFLFSLQLGPDFGERESSRNLWYEMRLAIQKISIDESYYICFIKNISKENENRVEKEMLQDRFDSLLQNTGDFLWSFDVEDRSMRLLTPMMDEEHRVIPQSVGLVDIHKMMPEGDYALLDKVLNERVKDYRNYGVRGDPFETLKVRFYGSEKTLVWYGLRGKLTMDENNRLVLQGTARRMDVVLDNLNMGEGEEVGALFNATLTFPDIRVFWVDRDYKIHGCNQAFATDFQIIDSHETYGKQLDQVVSHRMLPTFSRVLSEVLNMGRSVSWKGGFEREDRLLMFNAMPLKAEDGSVSGVMGVYLLLDRGDFTDEA